MMIVLLLLCAVFALAMLPQMWVRSVIKKHSADRPDLAGTGAEFARHMLDRLGLNHVKVEETALGDHYDPEVKAVRLLPANMNGKSLAAVVIAAHEVGHAMQDATDYPPLKARTRLAKQAMKLERFGAVVMLAAPIVMLLSKSPHIMVLQVFAGVMILGMTILIHAVTLPTEFDASYRRAMPALDAGGYLSAKDRPAAKEILRAAALTYVAAAALSMLDVMRWLRVLKF